MEYKPFTGMSAVVCLTECHLEEMRVVRVRELAPEHLSGEKVYYHADVHRDVFVVELRYVADPRHVWRAGVEVAHDDVSHLAELGLVDGLCLCPDAGQSHFKHELVDHLLRHPDAFVFQFRRNLPRAEPLVCGVVDGRYSFLQKLSPFTVGIRVPFVAPDVVEERTSGNIQGIAQHMVAEASVQALQFAEFLLYRRMGGALHGLEDGYDVFKALHLSAELAYPSRRPL